MKGQKLFKLAIAGEDQPATVEKTKEQRKSKTLSVPDVTPSRKRQAVVSVATSSCASARKDGENEPNLVNGCVPMKKSVSGVQ